MSHPLHRSRRAAALKRRNLWLMRIVVGALLAIAIAGTWAITVSSHLDDAKSWVRVA